MIDKSILLVAALIFTAWTLSDYQEFRMSMSVDDMPTATAHVFNFIVFSFWIGVMTLIGCAYDLVLWVTRTVWRKIT